MSGDSNVTSQPESKPAETTVPPTNFTPDVPLDKPVVNEDAAYGYDCYPERLGNKYVPTWTETILGRGKEESEKVKCEERVWNVAKSHPLVQLMMSALEKSGCAIDLRRHVACEVCDTTVTGGYDIENNQIVVCQNMCKSDNLTAGVLTHEMIHMFDHCRNHIDFKDMEHLACTEIKAANLTHCSFITSVAHGSSSLINVKETHAECVKVKAAWSVVAVHKVPIDVAKSVVNHVFDKCYQDLEPIGRRCRRNSLDPYMAYRERQHYGY